MKYMSARLFACLAVASITSACNQTSTTKLDAGVTVFEEPTLTAAQTATTFPNTPVGSDSPQQKITFSNIGLESTGPVSLVFEGPSAGEFILISSNCGQPLVYMTSCEVSVLFRPLTQGSKMARLTASATPGKTFSVILSATSQSPASATINPMIGTFPAVSLLPPGSSMMPTTPMIAFTVTNIGGTPAALEATIDGTDSGEFQMADGCSGPLLQPNANCTITVFFSPTTEAAKKMATLTVTGDHIKLTVPLQGAANGPAMLTMTPTMQDFGSVQFGMTNVQQFQIKNDGGQATGKLSTNIVGPSASGFSITNSTCTDVLNPADVCTVLVTFAPTAPNGIGQKTALLNVLAPMGGNLTASLTGNALAQVTQGGMLSLMSIGGPNPFGTVTIGSSATAFFSVQNSGTVPIGKIMASLAGSGNDFAVTNNGCPDMLGISETCLMTVSFTPLNVGIKMAALQVYSLTGGFANLGLMGNAVAGAQLSITPGYVQFTRKVNSTTTNNPTLFTIRNIGNDVTGPITVALEGADIGNFQLVVTDCQNITLQRGASCTARVRFVPLAAGNYQPMLTATATPGNKATAILSGTGQP